MIEIIGWITVVIVGAVVAILAVSYLLFRYFVWSVRNNVIIRYGLTPTEQAVLACAEAEYRAATGGLRLPPAQIETVARIAKIMPVDIKRDIASGRILYTTAWEQLDDPQGAPHREDSNV